MLDRVAQWKVDEDAVANGGLEKKWEELTWLYTVVYGVGGWAARKRSETGVFVPDFPM